MSNRNAVTRTGKAKSAASASRSATFTSQDAKVAMIVHGVTVTGLAHKLGLARNTVSMAINRGLFPRVRRLIAHELELP